LLAIVGEDVAELAAEIGIAIGIAIGSLEPLDLIIGELTAECESRRYGIDGETARRLELLG
jgi:hypothetical protein